MEDYVESWQYTLLSTVHNSTDGRQRKAQEQYVAARTKFCEKGGDSVPIIE